jgi:hypothetical protein
MAMPIIVNVSTPPPTPVTVMITEAPAGAKGDKGDKGDAGDPGPPGTTEYSGLSGAPPPLRISPAEPVDAECLWIQTDEAGNPISLWLKTNP